MRRLHRRLQLHFIGLVLVVAAAAAGVVAATRGAPSKRPFILLGVLVFVAGAVTAPIARRISRPIERLTAASRRFGEGDLTTRVPVDDPDCVPASRPGLPHGRRHWHRHHAGRHFRHHRRGPDELAALTAAWNDMADRVERMVHGQRELLANVSHELRSPLARVRVALELLPREGALEPRLRDIEADLAELDRLIEDVLTTARLDVTGLSSRLEELDLATLASELERRAAHDPTTTGRELRLDIASLPPFPADRALIRRALWNLIENAAKYGSPPIRLRARTTDGGVEIAVVDEGAGIPEPERERVTEPFYRAEKARTPGQAGFGLGLTLARRIAEAHGGSLSVGAGDAGTGCVVTLHLPFTRA